MDQPWKGSFKFAYVGAFYRLDVEFPLKKNLRKLALYRKQKSEDFENLVELSEHELGILAVLADSRTKHKDAQHFLPGEEILKAVWGFGEMSSVYNSVSTLRYRLKQWEIIEKIPKRGYRLAPEVEVVGSGQDFDRDLLKNAPSDHEKWLFDFVDRQPIKCHYFKDNEAAIQYLLTQYDKSKNLHKTPTPVCVLETTSHIPRQH